MRLTGTYVMNVVEPFRNQIDCVDEKGSFSIRSGCHSNHRQCGSESKWFCGHPPTTLRTLQLETIGWHLEVFCPAQPKRRQYSSQCVFDKKFVLVGVEKLKLKISKLPAGSKVLWMDRIASVGSSKAPGSVSLAYPPEAVVEQVKRYAQKKHLAVEIVSANPPRS